MLLCTKLFFLVLLIYFVIGHMSCRKTPLFLFGSYLYLHIRGLQTMTYGSGLDILCMVKYGKWFGFIIILTVQNYNRIFSVMKKKKMLLCIYINLYLWRIKINIIIIVNKIYVAVTQVAQQYWPIMPKRGVHRRKSDILPISRDVDQYGICSLEISEMFHILFEGFFSKSRRWKQF